MDGDTTRMPFDQYQRYRLVADVLGNVRKDGERLEVLDVGGRTALLRRFLPEDRVELVDVEESEEEGLVLGSGARLPFRDGAFDAVVCFDTLEHVPPALRDDFVDECARVARRWVVIAGPYHTAEVARAEELLQRFLHEKLEQRHRYLEEHRSHGLPDRKRTETRLRDVGARVRSIGHARLDRWLGLMCLSLYMDRDPALRGIAEGFHRFYNEALYDSDHAKSVYRHAVVAAFGKEPLPKVAELLGPPVAPKGSLKPVLHLVRELLAFDSRRDVVEAEWQRLHEVNRQLERDVAEHERSLADLRSELACRDAVIEEKDAGIAALEKRLDEVQGAATSSNDALAKDLDQHRETVSSLREELDQHRETVSSLRKELDRERAAGAAERDHLREELDHHRTSLQELARLRGELQQVVQELEAIVVDKDEAIAAVQSELDRERTEGGRVREILERDLDAHRKHAAALERERDDFAGEVSRLLAMLREERLVRDERQKSVHAGLELHQGVMRDQEELYRRQRTEAAALEEDLNRHRAVLGQLREELENSMASRERREVQLQAEIERNDAAITALTNHLTEAQEALAAEREQAAALREELNSRWRSLLRAVTPRRDRA